MANKRINELALRTPQTTDLILIGDPTTGYSYKTTLLSALNLGVPTTRTITINGTTFDLSANRTWSVGTVTSVGLTMPSAFNVASSPVTGSGTIAVTAAGLASQYIRGDGTLADFPGGGGGGGASVSYYLNGSVNQGTIGGVTYYEMNKTPILGAGTNFTTSSNGYIASFITDAGDPALLKIPGGNWNTEFYFAASSGGGTPTYYLELYKYDGTTFTLIASSSSNPDTITGGTSVEQYFTTIAVPETVLTATDRLAIRIYVTTAGRTITLHTEDNNLCQIITTFTTGLTALNGLTAQVQYFATGSAGTDFNISSSTATHTFNIPTASSVNRGLLSTADWTTFNNKVSSIIAGNAITVSNASGNVVTVNHADTSGADPGATISGSNVFRSIVLDTYGHVTGLSYSSFLISDLGGTAISSPSNGQVLSYNGTNWVNSSLSGLSIITGSGTTNYLPKFTGTSTIGNSLVFDNGTSVGIGTASPSSGKLVVNSSSFQFIAEPTDVATYGYLGIGHFANGTFIGTYAGSNASSDILRLGTSGTERVRINASGNVLVNTTTDNLSGAKLQVTGAATFSSSVTAGQYFSDVSSGTNQLVLRTSGIDRGYIQASNASLILNSLTGNDIQLQTNSSTKVTISSSGNIGIGVTPSAWLSSVRALQFSTSGVLWALNNQQNTFLSTNEYLDSAASVRYINNGFATRYQQIDGSHIWYNAPSGTAGNTISFTQAMTLDASGRLGIGTTSPSARLHTYSSTTMNQFTISGVGAIKTGINFANGGTTYGQIYFDHNPPYDMSMYQQYSTGSLIFGTNNTERMRITSGGNVGIGTTSPDRALTVNGQIGVNNDFVSTKGGTTFRIGYEAYASTGGVNMFTESAIPLVLGTNSTERMRITSGGRVGIGTTIPGYRLHVNSGDVNGIGAFFTNGINADLYFDFTSGISLISPTTGILAFGTNSTERMRITSGGEVYIAGTTDQGAYNLQVNGTGVWGAGAYVNGSDIKLKNNINTITEGLALINKIRPVSFQYNDNYSKDTNVQTGFIAQELKEVFANESYLNGLVIEGPNHLNVAYQNLMAVMVKAIQELKIELDNIKSDN